MTCQGAVDSMLAYLDAHPEVDSHRYAETVADVLLHGVERQACFRNRLSAGSAEDVPSQS